MAEVNNTLEWAKLQAATSLDIRKDIDSISGFAGEVGALNHFVRSCDAVSQRITSRQQTGRLDDVDSDSLRRALIRRIHRDVLNILQADEDTAWEEVKRRLQKEYGGGRWSPDEDALRLLRFTRGLRQSKGEYADQLLRQYCAVADKYRETLPGPEASAKIGFLEGLVRVQLGEATDTQVTGPVIEEAHRLIDAAGREEEREPHWRRPRDERPRYRQEEARRTEIRRPSARYMEGRRPDRQPGLRRERGATHGTRRREDPTCYTCGKKGHIQAKCQLTKCFECQTPGHLARNCPYLRPARRAKGEPMEVNYHGPARRHPAKQNIGRPEGSSSDSEEVERERQATDSESEAASYATVVRRGRGSPRRGRREPETRE